jgi:hypothetical protein
MTDAGEIATVRVTGGKPGGELRLRRDAGRLVTGLITERGVAPARGVGEAVSG